MMKWLRAILAWLKNLFAKNKMRRKIRLYIGEQQVDLDDQSFILFNYTMDDLSNPTIVKNSFSQQITLKGTPTNNKIFGDYFRLDRRVGNGGGETGADFNASQKTPFTIYNEMNEILESGYVKLDSISRQGADIQYKITLYGGLGSFFYALSYDENGNKRTLADLEYLQTNNPEAELDFEITAQSVQEAWTRLQGNTSAPAMWDVINFAPAYNGIPDGNFSPDKALVVPSEVGLDSLINQEDGENIKKYYLKAGYALVNLAEAQDEWAVKDLRSYLQRPVFSMRAFWDAISRPDNNGGYQVDASVVMDSDRMGVYSDLWMTLPMITSLGTIRQETGDLSLAISSTASAGNYVGRYTIVESVPSGTKVTANLSCRIRFNVPSGADAYNSLSRSVFTSVGRNEYGKFSVIFIQAVAFGSNNSVVGGSKIKVIGGNASTAAACGYVPAWGADYEEVIANTFNKVSSGVFEIPSELGFAVTAQDVSYYQIRMAVYAGTTYFVEGSGIPRRYSYSGDGTISTPVLYVSYDTGYTPNSTFIVQGASGNSISYTTSKSLRSGAVITKSMLLSSSHTPAEYMLSFCKIFGLYFTYDNATRMVSVKRRDELYQDQTIDLTRRVDVSKGISIQPMVFNAKWYDFLLESVGGAFNDEYVNVEGIPYGIQRVNTGFDFNADSVNLMDSVVFKNACTILSRSKYFNYIFKATSDHTFPLSEFTANAWYTGNVIGGVLTLTEVEGCLALKTQVSPGEKYQITSHGGDIGRAWYLLDINENIVAMSVVNYNTTQTFTIPSNVYYMVAQTDNGSITLKRLRKDIFYPSPFLDKGNTFTLWAADGETLETDISCPPVAASLEYYNEIPAFKGYDINTARKLELRNADNKPIDGADILVFHEGWDTYPYFKLTDDIPEMDLINEGVPCWLLGAGGSGIDSLRIPTFQRYSYGNVAHIEDSLDFGIPKQFDIPGIYHEMGCTLYERFWKAYMSDRYDVNTKVMTCRVNFGGMPVNQELLRKFYWYDNSLWVLNKIRNYSLTTFDPVECEFVQVQDKRNYIGQNISYYLRVVQSSFDIPSIASTLTIDVRSNVSWRAESENDYISVSPTSGQGDGQIQVQVTANTSQSRRFGYVRLICTSGQVLPNVYISIMQEASAQNYMAISPASLNVSKAASTQLLSVQSNVSWRVETSANFVTLSPTTGTGNASIQAIIAANTSGEQRTASIRLINTSGEGLPDAYVSIVQDADTQYYMTISPNTINVGHAATTQNLSVRSNVSWRAETNDAFLTLSPTTGTGNGNVQVSISANPNASTRTGTIRLVNTSGEGLPDELVTINQSGSSTYVCWMRNPLAPGYQTSDTVAADSVGTNAELYANAAWRLVANANWLYLLGADYQRVSEITGEAVSRLTQFIGTDANTTGQQRVGTLTLSIIADPSVSLTYTITQNA